MRLVKVALLALGLALLVLLCGQLRPAREKSSEGESRAASTAERSTTSPSVARIGIGDSAGEAMARSHVSGDVDPGDDWVLDPSYAPKENQVIWEAEREGFHISLSSYGNVMVNSAAGEESRRQTPGEVFDVPVVRQLYAEAMDQMKRLLPLKRRREAEAEIGARESERQRTAYRKPVDPSAFGYETMAEMKEAYRSRELGLLKGQDVEVYLERGDNGEYSVGSMITQVTSEAEEQ